MQERCERIDDTVTIHERPRRGHHIRFAGEDVSAGSELIRRGKGVSARGSNLVGSGGDRRRPSASKNPDRTALDRNRIKEPGEPLEHGQIYDSNQIMLSSLLAACPWAEIVDFGMVPDCLGFLKDVVARALTSCDALVTRGGVSAGERAASWIGSRRSGAMH
ncbi:hypothetical protein BFX40_10840 [Mesorhizobium sp. SEMIA 3007]|nr:hypothetical protein BFX40_10840 [Mesorhizobium sp. SEMIA 3007]